MKELRISGRAESCNFIVFILLQRRKFLFENFIISGLKIYRRVI